MSNSRAKYEELVHEFEAQSHNQRSMSIILEIIKGAHKAEIMDVLLDKVHGISQSGPRLSPVVVFQLAAEEAKVDELCN